jgi:hypothetical protein
MFNLEQAIKDWRQRLLAAGVENPETLEELESHLREDIERQLRSGANEPGAFERAVRQMGSGRQLKTEFTKDNETRIMKRTLIIMAGIIGILVGLALVMPAVAQYRHDGAMTGEEVWLLFLGAVLTLGGGSAAFLGMRKRAA